LHKYLKGGSLTSSIGASNKGKFPKDMSPIFTKFAAYSNFLKVLQNYDRTNRFQYLADILILSGLVIVCALVFGLLGKIVSVNVFKMNFQEFWKFLADASWFENTEHLKLYNVFSTFGAWVFSGFLLFRIRGYRRSEFWSFDQPVIPRTWIILPVLFISAIFIASFLLYLNQSIQIPQHLKESLGSDNSEKLLSRMLEMHSVGELMLNIFIIALVPAIFEEIFFRGTLQPLLIGLTGNKHIGIIFCSFLFAAIHLNIMQIIPMFFLAIVLGYLYQFTQSLLPGIVLHFCNNTLAILANYYSHSSSLAKKVADDTYVPGMAEVLLFTFILAAIFYYFYKQSKQSIINE
jgi:membrane protease YdiL (CAAX protease family)